MVQNENKFCLLCSMSQESHIIWFYGAHLQNDNISRIFFILSKFWFSMSLGGPKMKNKNHIHHMPYLRNSIAYDHDFWLHLSKMISPGFFYFPKILIFWVVRRGKGQRVVQNDKNSQKPCIVWSSIMVHL